MSWELQESNLKRGKNLLKEGNSRNQFKTEDNIGHRCLVETEQGIPGRGNCLSEKARE